MGASRFSQSWKERLERERFAWEQQITVLCDAFLAFSRRGPPSTPPLACDSSSPPKFSITCIHLTGQFDKHLFQYPVYSNHLLASEKLKRTFIPGHEDNTLVQTLARYGYFTPTPTSPSCAIHVDVLRYCVALRRHASNTSLQAIATAICEVHNVKLFPLFTLTAFVLTSCYRLYSNDIFALNFRQHLMCTLLSSGWSILVWQK